MNFCFINPREYCLKKTFFDHVDSDSRLHGANAKGCLRSWEAGLYVAKVEERQVNLELILEKNSIVSLPGYQAVER